MLLQSNHYRLVWLHLENQYLLKRCCSFLLIVLRDAATTLRTAAWEITALDCISCYSCILILKYNILHILVYCVCNCFVKHLFKLISNNCLLNHHLTSMWSHGRLSQQQDCWLSRRTAYIFVLTVPFICTDQRVARSVDGWDRDRVMDGRNFTIIGCMGDWSSPVTVAASLRGWNANVFITLEHCWILSFTHTHIAHMEVCVQAHVFVCVCGGISLLLQQFKAYSHQNKKQEEWI